MTAGLEDNVLEKAFVFNGAKNQYIHLTQLNADWIPGDAFQNYSQITVQEPIALTIFRRDSNSSENSLGSHLSFNQAIATKLCRCHDSFAVVAFAKLLEI